MTTDMASALPGAGKRIGILTSGGDAQGMNAAVRAVVRTAVTLGAQVYAVFEGYQGMVDGGDGIRELDWDDVGSILGKGGTMIGTFRSKDFREYAGRKRSALNLLANGIDRLVVIGGDGSLTGLDQFRGEWSQILAELVAEGQLAPEVAAAHPALMFAGLVGSIDNDLVGTDMTIGADTALHRIVSAIDDLSSTAASHQRGFVVEVMGRHCGYLALMSAIAGGCDYVLIPETPPEAGWEQKMCAELRRGRQAGRRDSMVVVAEGACDRQGQPITSGYVRQVIQDTLNEDARVTILGHVQRGGAPSAYDRWASTWLGHEAVLEVLNATPGTTGPVIGFRGNRIHHAPLIEAVAKTRKVPELIAAGDYNAAMELRGGSFTEAARIFAEMSSPSRVDAGAGSKRIAIIHGGGLAPGMNAAAADAVRLGISRGHTMLGIQGGFPGLRDGKITELEWADVEGWLVGGADLGTRRTVPTVEELYRISRTLEDQKVDALLMIGGWNGYEAAHLMHAEAERFPACGLPIACLPASIDNNLPGSELAIGADTALNVITEAIDRIKMSGAASRRAFVVETMGRHCGYLALMSALAGGAERVYLHEEGISLNALIDDVEWLRSSFAAGRKLFLAVRNEEANPLYTTDFLARLLEQESQGLYDVRQNVLGHIQQGGSPSPFDRLLAVRLVSRALDLLNEGFINAKPESFYLGLVESKVTASPLAHMLDDMDTTFRRPKNQWWLALRPVMKAVADAPV
ncbi:6-phosphofructokinase [Propionicimonas sp.]|uniref:6-phosphofructokinase n=1 Tax=Propionicimonas sp. TaxID=1955623 RepID=UPI0017B5876A|nr:6-phosphofructokinase [Propionicimonas sp.]MBU3975635.1 6-phosphofructokinase [Actinomycetota bacterium]MBA3019962.1 6-phosphofructokinase [Propionicimonas sp.]MBU3986216.1 6-phosphofructokinase [Actinomycetota bacterium]MBU4007785.1 6-phosphofructokinase [Actinomycetota bacterium]MBU4064043.1 6-phosphofructokinase [Actinomycetota bacterium]